MGVQINGSEGNVIATKGTFSGDVGIGGTLTYEDVTNIDSVGLVTARNGIEIGARPGVAASISVDGNMIVSGISTFNSRVLLGTTTEGQASADDLTIATSGNTGITLRSGTSNTGNIYFSDATSGTAEYAGYVSYSHSTNSLSFGTNDGTERLRITSDGKVGINSASPEAELTVLATSTVANSLTFKAAAGQIFRNEDAEFAFGLSNSTPYPLFIQGRYKNNSARDIAINSLGGKILIGDDTDESTMGLSANVQTFGTDASTSGVAIRRGSNDAQAAFLVMSKSRNTSVGSRTILQNGDEVGNIFFVADDGTDLASNTAAIKSQIDAAPGANDTPGNLTFWTTADGSNSATQRMKIDSSGRLLVGHTSPTSVGVGAAYNHPLQVIGNSYDTSGIVAARYSDSTGGAQLHLVKSRNATKGSQTIVQVDDTLGFIRWYGSDGTDTTNAAATISAEVDATPASDKIPGRLSFWTTDTLTYPRERLRIQSNGNVMVGDAAGFTSNTAKFDIFFAGGGSGQPTYVTRFFQNTDSQNTDHACIQLRHAAATGSQTAVMIDFKNASGSSHGSIKMAASSVSFNTTSDYRLKENEVTISDAISKVKQLKPYTFNFKADSNTTIDGFFAHEAQEVIPYAVTGEKDAEEMQSMDYGKLTPLLTAALQEAISEIETLKAEVAALKSN